jgi:hypothetical protein
MRWFSTVLTICLLPSIVLATSRLTPPVLPLIVRNPYLSTWLSDARDIPWEHWPIFYTGDHIGLSVLVQVPSTGIVYPLLGRPQDSLLPVRKGDGYEVLVFTRHVLYTHRNC